MARTVESPVDCKAEAKQELKLCVSLQLMCQLEKENQKLPMKS